MTNRQILEKAIEKNCLQCDALLTKKPKQSYKQWEYQRFCSNACSATFYHPKGAFCLVCSKPLRRYGKTQKCIKHVGLGRKGSEVQREAIRKRLATDNPMKRPEVRAKLSGANSPLWKGGITPLNQAIRTSTEYKEWRKAVFERDDYTCQMCGARGVRIHADHVKRFADYIELRFELTNGRTLCVPCHKETPTYGRKRATANIGA